MNTDIDTCSDDCVEDEINCFLDLVPDVCNECMPNESCNDETWWDNIDCVCNVNGEHIEGDINYDGDVNVVDVVNLVNWVLDDHEYDCNADLYYDGNINVVDVVNLINLILNGSEDGDCDE